MAKAILIPCKEKRVMTGHPWIFRSDIAGVEGDAQPGDVVEIYSNKGVFQAQGYYNPLSQIALRIMTYRQNEKVDRDFIFPVFMTPLNTAAPLPTFLPAV